MSRPIFIKNLSLSFLNKTCFEAFSATVYAGSRIGIVGRNGSGKSTLLSIIVGHNKPTTGEVIIPAEAVLGYVPQIINSLTSLSGAEQFNNLLTQALIEQPTILCLDEPTNHLDRKNRASLMRFLQHYSHTLIIVSHDIEMLKTIVSEIWFIDENKITIFAGYDAFIKERQYAQAAVHKKIKAIKKAQTRVQAAVQHEQKRVARSKHANKYENDRNLLGTMKQSGNVTAGKQQGKLNAFKNSLHDARQELYVPEVITPSFNFQTCLPNPNKAVITVVDGSCGYDIPVVTNIQLSINGCQRIALYGDNGSGKSTFVKALCGDDTVITSGQWLTPDRRQIGYLDQHYRTLNPQKSVYQVIEDATSGWTSHQIRKHLNDFLFRTNEEIAKLVFYLSGGERARLSLAQIAAISPQLLILDEVTNNLDLETKEHVIQTLKAYPGTLIVISHDQDFLACIDIKIGYLIDEKKLKTLTLHFPKFP